MRGRSLETLGWKAEGVFIVTRCGPAARKLYVTTFVLLCRMRGIVYDPRGEAAQVVG